MPAQHKRSVRFFLPPRYFVTNGGPDTMARITCFVVLGEAFGMAESTALNMMRANSNGFDIVCTREQFAMFIIRGHEIGGYINSIRDLNPRIVTIKETVFQRNKRIAKKAGVRVASCIDVTRNLVRYVS